MFANRPGGPQIRRERFVIRRWSCRRDAGNVLQHPDSVNQRRGIDTVGRDRNHAGLGKNATSTWINGRHLAKELPLHIIASVINTDNRFIQERELGIDQLAHPAVLMQQVGKAGIGLGSDLELEPTIPVDAEGTWPFRSAVDEPVEFIQIQIIQHALIFLRRRLRPY